MAGRTGLEPATSGVTGRRSNQLNYRPRETTRTNIFKEPVFGIGPTGDLPDKSGRSNQLNYRPREKKKKQTTFAALRKNGRRNRDRTCDISLVRAALSQLSYPPILCSTTAKNILLIRLFACQVTLSQQKIKMTAHAQMTVELLLLEGH